MDRPGFAEKKLADAVWPTAAHAAPQVAGAPGARATLAHHLIESQAALRPRAPALSWQDQVWTYAQLDQQANHLAARLRSMGVGANQLVGICVERSPQAIVAILAVLKAGGAYLPLDPAYPRQRLAFMLEDSGIEVVLTQPGLAALLPEHEARMVFLDESLNARDANSSTFAHSPARGDNPLAYAIYTSGSTGRPKAALLTHRGLCNLMAAQRDVFRMNARSRVLLFASLSFDASVSEIFVTLGSGACLCLAPAAHLAPGPELARTLRELRISVVTLPPSILQLLGDVELPDLETLVVAGERCPAELASRWSAGRRLINAYGPTETTVCATMYECPSGEQAAPPIGMAMPNVDVYVLDDQRRPTVGGGTGELYIGGVGVAMGYLHRAALTTERFVSNPWSDDPAARLYRTGDLVRRRPDGNLEFVGRVDHQVKCLGVRIELDEISAALEQHPAIAQAVALAEQNENARPLIVANAVPRTGCAVTVSELRTWLGERLPVAMIPHVITLNDHIPLTPNGKVDRAAILALAEIEQSARTELVPARHALELQLVALWEDLFQRQDIGVTDDFFQIGGDSLLALELLVRIERGFQRALPVHLFVRARTIEKLADLLANQRAMEAYCPTVALQPCGARPPFFCVHPGGGNALCYLALSRYLGGDQPFHAFQAAGVDDESTPLVSVEQMAEQYLVALRDVQPRGPYQIGGWSFGAAVAYEMACRLLASGEKVALLAVFDAGIHYQFGVLRTMFPSEEGGLTGLLRRSPKEQLRLFCQSTAAAELVPPGATELQAQRIYRVFIANCYAMTDYRPPRYPGRLTLFTAADRIIRARHATLDEWRGVCDDVVEHIVPGNHFSIVHEPHVQQLAATLRDCLDQLLHAHNASAQSSRRTDATPLKGSCVWPLNPECNWTHQMPAGHPPV